MHELKEEEIIALGAYEVLLKEYVPDAGCEGYLLRHKKTGARICLLPADDNNKTFYIAFRTTPKDSTGVAHIIEHTVLCGSKDYNLKDPFVYLASGSLNTFMNAMTYSDKTVYPIASTNEKDFDNLMHAYLDAVFYPNIYREENIFRQEGWHYEVNDEGELSVNGVVYNEMKGALATPDAVLDDAILKSLYPDTTYAVISGGDPEVIPTLTYEEYLNFHRTYYHPSNSYIYLYGNCDMIGRLRYLDEAYLSHFDFLQMDTRVQPQKTFASPVEVKADYSLMTGEDPAGKAFLSWNAAMPRTAEKEEEQNRHDYLLQSMTMNVIDYVLCDSEGGPVREALRKSGICEDVDSTFDDGIMLPYYSISAKYTDPQQKETFRELVESTLRKVVREGLDPMAIEAGINYYEFVLREKDAGYTPLGLVEGLNLLDTWLYNEAAVFDTGHRLSILAELREKDPSWYTDFIRKNLIDNPHRSIVTLVPVPGLQAGKDKESAARLAKTKEEMTPEEFQAVKEKAEALSRWQDTPDNPEDVRKVPSLVRADLDTEGTPLVNEMDQAGPVPALTHPMFTDGILYLNLMFDTKQVPAELFPYLVVYRTFFGALDTKKHTYRELDLTTDCISGGISAGLQVNEDLRHPGAFRTSFGISVRVLPQNLDRCLDLVQEILFETKFEDSGRMLEVLEEERSGLKESLESSAHLTAGGRAMAHQSAAAAVREILSGISAYDLLKKVVTEFDTEKNELPARMEKIRDLVFTPANLFISLTGEEDKLPEAKKSLNVFAEKLPGEKENHEVKEDGRMNYETPLFVPSLTRKNEAFTIAGSVQYVAAAGHYGTGYADYRGTFSVLRQIENYDYLWQKLRVHGGAYGCAALFQRLGLSIYCTYRDPHLKGSLQVFRDNPDYIRSYEADEKTLTKYVINAIGQIDQPMTPRLAGSMARRMYMAGITNEDLQREREEILHCTKESIRRLADSLEKAKQDEVICVVGSREKIEENRDLFESVRPLT